MEKYGLPSTEDFGLTLARVADYAFSYCENFVPEQKEKPSDKWTASEMTEFMAECRVGFKLAQKQIIEQVLYYQQKLKENKDLIKASRSNHDKKKTQEYLSVIKLIERRLNNLSHIADGIVIELLGHQVHIAKRLHIGEKSNKQLEHSNLSHAIKVTDQLNENPGTFALLSDLTSYVQIGDLLVSDEEKGLYISELKEGKSNKRIREFIDTTLQNGFPCAGFQSDFSEKDMEQMKRMLRQDVRMQQAVEVINTDRGTDPVTGAEIIIKTPAIDLVYYDGIFLAMLEELKSKDWSYRLLEDCVHIGVYQGKTAHVMARATIPTILKKQTEHSIFIDLMNITEDLSETLFAKPFPKEFVIKIMIGQVKVMIGINLDKLIEVFNANGLKTRWLSTKETGKLKVKGNKIQYVTSKNRAIGIVLSSGIEAVMSGGIISKIAFDHILPSNLAASISSSYTPSHVVREKDDT
ncbi:hypothetical protein [Pedobacter sp. MR22-3]|uniref:hypothetical protein n=1 Tax=Pedobacter sp. MR22-3 TaxID=2994552 RepID=UPI002245384E|nr:hypothetical protein [Pedobacter sp. MR22-3]MCX2585935.1 hypothetical protein [Pedobacter sp. MR22-3]